MSSTLTGRATIFGFIGGISASGIGTLLNESADISREFKLEEIRDGSNDIKGFIASGELIKMRLQFTPVDAAVSLSGAATSLGAPSPLARVTLSLFKDTSYNHARWAYIGGWKVGLKKDNIATYELEIGCSPDAGTDLSAPVA